MKHIIPIPKKVYCEYLELKLSSFWNFKTEGCYGWRIGSLFWLKYRKTLKDGFIYKISNTIMGLIKGKDNITTVNYKIIPGGIEPFSILIYACMFFVYFALFEGYSLTKSLTNTGLALIVFLIPLTLFSMLFEKGKEEREYLKKFMDDVKLSACECYNMQKE